MKAASPHVDVKEASAVCYVLLTTAAAAFSSRLNV